MTKFATVYKLKLDEVTIQDIDLWLIGRAVYDVHWSQNYLTIVVQDI